MKDRIGENRCDLESVLFFHLECPDYVKKFDEPVEKSYLKRQIFNFLLLPYINTRVFKNRLQKSGNVATNDLGRRDSIIPYSEEMGPDKQYDLERRVLDNEKLANHFFGKQEEINFEERIEEVKEEAAEGGDAGGDAEEAGDEE